MTDRGTRTESSERKKRVRHSRDNETTATTCVTAPATDLAREWAGYGSALKPAIEDWWLLRKPLDGTIAGNCADARLRGAERGRRASGDGWRRYALR